MCILWTRSYYIRAPTRETSVFDVCVCVYICVYDVFRKKKNKSKSRLQFWCFGDAAVRSTSPRTYTRESRENKTESVRFTKTVAAATRRDRIIKRGGRTTTAGYFGWQNIYTGIYYYDDDAVVSAFRFNWEKIKKIYRIKYSDYWKIVIARRRCVGNAMPFEKYSRDVRGDETRKKPKVIIIYRW